MPPVEPKPGAGSAPTKDETAGLGQLSAPLRAAWGALPGWARASALLVGGALGGWLGARCEVAAAEASGSREVQNTVRKYEIALEQVRLEASQKEQILLSENIALMDQASEALLGHKKAELELTRATRRVVDLESETRQRDADDQELEHRVGLILNANQRLIREVLDNSDGSPRYPVKPIADLEPAPSLAQSFGAEIEEFERFSQQRLGQFSPKLIAVETLIRSGRLGEARCLWDELMDDEELRTAYDRWGAASKVFELIRSVGQDESKNAIEGLDSSANSEVTLELPDLYPRLNDMVLRLTGRKFPVDVVEFGFQHRPGLLAHTIRFLMTINLDPRYRKMDEKERADINGILAHEAGHLLYNTDYKNAPNLTLAKALDEARAFLFAAADVVVTQQETLESVRNEAFLTGLSYHVAGATQEHFWGKAIEAVAIDTYGDPARALNALVRAVEMPPEMEEVWKQHQSLAWRLAAICDCEQAAIYELMGRIEAQLNR